jgi:hypothetical protein
MNRGRIRTGVETTNISTSPGDHGGEGMKEK